MMSRPLSRPCDSVLDVISAQSHMRATGSSKMDEQINWDGPQHIVEALDASVKDLTAGRVLEADAVQAEARHMLAEHEAGKASTVSPRSKAKAGGRTRATR